MQSRRVVPVAVGLRPLCPRHIQHGQKHKQQRQGEIVMARAQDVYSIIYTNRTTLDNNQTVEVEVFKCSEDTSVDGHPWRGRAVSIYQLVSLFIIPAVITVFFYQAVIRVLWKSTK